MEVLKRLQELVNLCATRERGRGWSHGRTKLFSPPRDSGRSGPLGVRQAGDMRVSRTLFTDLRWCESSEGTYVHPCLRSLLNGLLVVSCHMSGHQPPSESRPSHASWSICGL